DVAPELLIDEVVTHRLAKDRVLNLSKEFLCLAREIDRIDMIQKMRGGDKTNFGFVQALRHVRYGHEAPVLREVFVHQVISITFGYSLEALLNGRIAAEVDCA